MTFWCGSGSVDQCLWLMDPDPDPSIFIIDLQDSNKKRIFLKTSKTSKRSHKTVETTRNQGFSYYFCLMIEGSGSRSIPLTSGSGSLWPKNKWIRWIQIRIRNTGSCMPQQAVWRGFSRDTIPLTSTSLPSSWRCRGRRGWTAPPWGSCWSPRGPAQEPSPAHKFPGITYRSQTYRVKNPFNTKPIRTKPFGLKPVGDQRYRV